jgi:hypothetical protein
MSQLDEILRNAFGKKNCYKKKDIFQMLIKTVELREILESLL